MKMKKNVKDGDFDKGLGLPMGNSLMAIINRNLGEGRFDVQFGRGAPYGNNECRVNRLPTQTTYMDDPLGLNSQGVSR
jgi:hypothetical protein